METHIERKLPHLRQFLNISFGVAIGALALSMPTSGQFQFQSLVLQIGMFLFLALAVTHAWWRQADMMSTTRLMRASTWVILFSRLVLTFWLIFVLRNLKIGSAGGWAWRAVFLSAGLLFALSALQQIMILRPLYGKTRVMQRREVITDTLLAVFTFAFAGGGFFQPQYFQAWYAPLLLLVVFLAFRPLARKMTVWNEPPPPHRGGRRPQSTAGRSGERPQRSQQRQRPQSQRTERSTGVRRISARALKGETPEGSDRERRESRARDVSPQRERRSPQRPRRRERPAPEPTETPAEPAPAAKPAEPVLSSPTPEPMEPVAPTPREEVPAVDHAAPEVEAQQPTPETTEPAAEEPQKIVYGRRLSKRGPKPSELTSMFGDESPETLEEIEKKLEETAEIVRPDAEQPISYGRKPRRKKPELIEEVDSEEEAPLAEQKDEETAEGGTETEPRAEAGEETESEGDAAESDEQDSRISSESEAQ